MIDEKIKKMEEKLRAFSDAQKLLKKEKSEK